MAAESSSIEWTDSTWNPIRGCTRISPGCGGPGPHGGCYAEQIAARFSDPGMPFHGIAERTSAGGRWTGKLALVEDALTQPLRWRKGRRIFVNSMSDLFHEKVPDTWIDRIFAVMALAPQHTFQVLTKRADRMREYMTHLHDEPARDTAKRLATAWPTGQLVPPDGVQIPLPNVWLGISAEDQRHFDERWAHLRDTPAAVTFVSMEPLLGPIFFRPARPGLVIVGGESGPRARPMHIAWARSLRDQCLSAGVPFFMKQMTKKATIPEDLFIREFPNARFAKLGFGAPRSAGGSGG